VFFTGRAQHHTARELGEQCLRLAEGIKDEGLVLEGHHALGVSLLCVGEFIQGLEHMEKVIAGYDPTRHGFLALRYGQDTGAVCRSHAAWAHWFLGHPAQALERAAETLILTKELLQPYSLVTVSVILAWLYQFCRNGLVTRELAETAVGLAADKEFAFWREMGVVMNGWAIAEQGQTGDGIAQMRSGLNTLNAAGAEINRSYLLSLLAGTYAQAGQSKEALSIVSEALSMAEKNGERYWLAELYRLKGELTLKQSKVRTRQSKDRQEAQQCFERALTIARGQQAKSLELRAAMSMSRLQHLQGEGKEARRGLAEIYDSFTEGFDTPDLREAKALLDDWS